MKRERPRPQSQSLASGIAVVALIAVVVFAPAATYGFAYDDHWTVERAAALRGGLAPLLRALLSGTASERGIPDATRPTMVVSLWIDRHVFGADPSGYHLHSLLLYAACSALAALAVFTLTRRRFAALAGGSLFAVFPVHAEVVAAVNYREDLLAGVAVFGVVAWLFAPRRAPATIEHAVLAGALLLMGLFAKESTIALIPIVLAASIARGDRGTWVRARRASFAVLGAALSLWAIWRTWLRLAGRDDVPLVLVHRGVIERLLRTARYTVNVAIDGLVPLRWSPDYAPEPPASAWWLLALALFLIFTYALARLPRTRALGAGVAIALVAGLPTSPLVSPINEHADRYAFLATLGGALFWGSLVARLVRNAGRRTRTFVLAACVVPLVIVARRAAAPWRSDRTLWATAIEREPTSARAWTGFSATLRKSGDLDGADRAAAKAIALEPTFLTARVNSVYNRLARGDVERARVELEEIRRRGGAHQLGMRRATQCAAGNADSAARCGGM